MGSVLYTSTQCGQPSYMNRYTCIRTLQNSGRFGEDSRLDQLSGRFALPHIFGNIRVSYSNIPIGSADTII